MKPKYLFVVADGSRPDHSCDENLCKECRDYILNEVDWDCELKTLFRENNRGCGLGPSEAITWFFEHVNQGIILEDDILATTDFFEYTSELLEKYKNHSNVMGITGFNLQKKIKKGKDSYYFSTFPGIWGWATWKESWKEFDYYGGNLKSYISSNNLKRSFPNQKVQATLIREFNTIATTDAWDYAWRLAVFSNNGIIAVPYKQLITNIGIGTDQATHTMNSIGWASKKVEKMEFPLVHPAKVERYIKADHYYAKKVFSNSDLPLIVKLLLKFPTIIYCFLFNSEKRNYYSQRLLSSIKNRLIKKNIYVFGDSHTEVFEHLNSSIMVWKWHFDISSIGGATAQGLRNPNSKTQALKIFKEKIDSIQNKNSILIFQLGEVDTGFLIWFRHQKFGEKIEDAFNDSITAYMTFLNELVQKGYKKIFVLSAPLPSIKDNQNWGEIANARKEIKTTQKERTELTLKYNHRLSTECKKLNINFIGMDDMLLDKETKLLSDQFYNKDRNNHHLNLSSYSKIIQCKFSYEF